MVWWHHEYANPDDTSHYNMLWYLFDFWTMANYLTLLCILMIYKDALSPTASPTFSVQKYKQNHSNRFVSPLWMDEAISYRDEKQDLIYCPARKQAFRPLLRKMTDSAGTTFGKILQLRSCFAFCWQHQVLSQCGFHLRDRDQHRCGPVNKRWATF